jgi:hypothetical protein
MKMAGRLDLLLCNYSREYTRSDTGFMLIFGDILLVTGSYLFHADGERSKADRQRKRFFNGILTPRSVASAIRGCLFCGQIY